MKYLGILILFVSVNASAAVINDVTCTPGQMNSAGTEWRWMDCQLQTDDAGSMSLTIFSSTGTARMRVDANGDLLPADVASIRAAVRSAYRVRIAAERAAEVAHRQNEQLKMRGTLLFPASQVE